jgi:hypothetical protein
MEQIVKIVEALKREVAETSFANESGEGKFQAQADIGAGR